ncbi:MAG: 16S rRNA (uracil(1498)-N(3))-methyltransferase [Pyrinomonadaceae bacterium]
MTRRRFYAPLTSFTPDGKSVLLAADEARHLRDVLRLKQGDEVFVFDGAGREVQCAVAEVRRDLTHLEIVREAEPARPESPMKLTLGVALLKSDKFDLVVQKVTELGVAAIVPLVTKQADIRFRDDSDASKRVTRWQRIALESSKQSGRAVVPQVFMPAAFDLFVQRDESSTRLLFSERDGQSLLDMKHELPEKLPLMVAVVGPEGGWTDAELSLARDNNWTIVTIGGRTLRAETAAITATALLQHLFGDLT